MNDKIQLELEVDQGSIYVNGNRSVYISFHRDYDQLMINEMSGIMTIEQMEALIAYLGQLEENLR